MNIVKNMCKEKTIDSFHCVSLDSSENIEGDLNHHRNILTNVQVEVFPLVKEIAEEEITHHLPHPEMFITFIFIIFLF